MDVMDQINTFKSFVELNAYDALAAAIHAGQKFIVVEFNALSSFSPELAEQLLEDPEEVVRAAEVAIEQFDFDADLKNFRVRFANLPVTQQVAIREIRARHIGKLIQIGGIIRQKSDVRPQVTSAKFECPSCGNIMTILQVDSHFKEPTRCGCGRKGKFKLLSKELVDAQKIVLEEAPEDLEGGEQPKRLDVFLKNDLVSPISEKRTTPGSKVLVVGIIKEVAIPSKEGGKLTRFELMQEANLVVPVTEDFTQINISAEELEQIKSLGHDPKVYAKLISSIAPSIYGHEKVKEALILQLMGGTRKKRDDGNISRGDIHILLIGDPGSGKSQLLKRISIVAPKSRYVSGKGASGAGMTASVVKDEFLRGWALEAGALVLTNNGICCIDELDKMSQEDTSAMHEALEQQTISINKANIQATLRAETTVLAAANPKLGRFDPFEMIAKQINLPSTLINRFDLIFPIRDLPSVEKDEQLATFILTLHQKQNVGKTEIPTELIKKFVSYARQHVNPRLTDAALSEIKEYYVKMRNSGEGNEGGIKAIPISARQLEALVRLSEASARVRLSDKVTKQDAQRAIELVHFTLTQIGVDPETGKIDIDRITTGITATQRGTVSIIKELISELEAKIGKMIPVDDIIAAAKEKNISEDKVDEVLASLNKWGDIFFPKPGFMQRI